MRSLLTVHGDDALAALSVSEASDIIIETDSACDAALQLCIAARESGKQIWVHAVALTSDRFDESLAAAMLARPTGIILPYVSGPENIEHLGAKLRVHEARLDRKAGETRIIAMINTAAGALTTPRLRPNPRLAALAWQSFQVTKVDLHGSDVWRHARAMTILAAMHLGIPAIDASLSHEQADANFHDACTGARQQGFAAMLAQSEPQVRIINAIFGQNETSQL